MPEFRKPQGLKYPLSLLLICLLFTELKNCHRQRQRARWIKGNWDWISRLWKEITKTEKQAPQSSPSQSTFSRLLNKINLFALETRCSTALRMHKLNESNGKKEDLILNHYGIDGKSRKGIVSPETGRTEIDVAIFNVKTREVIATKILKDKVGESNAAVSMLRKIGKSIPPGLFTGDASFTTPKFTKSIISAGHEYLFGFKDNSGDAYQACLEMDWDKSPVLYESLDKDHGRNEVRRLKRIVLPKSMAKKFDKYKNIGYLFCIESERTIKNNTSFEKRYYIGSKGLKGIPPKIIAEFIREHWLQENGLHWVKDTILGEDESFVMSHRSSRVLSFFKNIVVSIGYSIYKSVQRFVDEFDASPKKIARSLFFLE